MAIPDGLLKLVVSGTLAGGAERFAFSLWHKGYTGAVGAGSLDLDLLAADSVWLAFVNQLAVMMTTGDEITSYDTYWYQGGEAVQHAEKAVAIVGTGASTGFPCQVATVLTLRTALATRRGRGRIYLPTRNLVTSGATGKLSSPANVNSAADKLAAYFSELTSPISAVVVSQTGGFSTDITSVSVDDVPDTQRRRRNKLVGAVHTAAVV